MRDPRLNELLGAMGIVTHLALRGKVDDHAAHILTGLLRDCVIDCGVDGVMTDDEIAEAVADSAHILAHAVNNAALRYLNMKPLEDNE